MFLYFYIENFSIFEKKMYFFETILTKIDII